MIRAQILVIKFEFGGSFGMSLEGDCHEVEDTPNFGINSHFWYELGGSLS
jgi:hypothetical protein